jgi:CRISPR system Cascade subunit CasE
MFLSRLILNPMSREVRSDVANPYELHRTLMKAYPHERKDGERAELLFRVEPVKAGSIVVLVQSRKLPDWSLLPTDYAEIQGPKSLEHVRFHTGQRLQFRLRANPTKRLRETSKIADGTTVEAKWIDKRVGLFREEDQQNWFELKAKKCGFNLLGLRLVPEGNVRAWKGSQELTFVSVLFEGQLEVTDEAAFLDAWLSGIGSGKGMGFGMLSLASA